MKLPLGKSVIIDGILTKADESIECHETKHTYFLTKIKDYIDHQTDDKPRHNYPT